MAGLNDFFANEANVAEKQPTIKDFKTTKKTSVFNSATVENLSFKLGLISPEHPESMEAMTKAEIEENESMYQTSEVLQQARSVEQKEARAWMEQQVERLGPAQAPERERVIEGWLDGRNKQLSTDELLYNKALKESTSRGTMTPEKEQEIASWAEVYQEAAAVRQLEAGAIHSATLANDTGIAGTLANFAEILIPFGEWSVMTDIKDKLMSDEASIRWSGIVALGEHKEEIKEWYQAMPAEERLRTLPILVEALQSNNSLVLNENEMVRADFLRTIIDGEHYGSFSKWLDNAIGVLDVVGVGFAAKGILGGTSLTGKALRASAAGGVSAVGKLAAKKTVKKAGKSTDDVSAITGKGKLPTKDGDVNPNAVDDVELLPSTSARNSDVADRAVADATTGAPHPESPLQVIKDADPQKVVDVVEDIARTGDKAKARKWGRGTIGDAVGWLFGPKIGTKGGLISRMPTTGSMDETLAMMRSIGNTDPHTGMRNGLDNSGVSRTGRIDLSDSEKLQSSKKEQGRLQNPAPVTSSANTGWIKGQQGARAYKPTQIVARLNESTHDLLEDGGLIKMNYGPGTSPDAYFTSPQRAAKYIEPALRHAGISGKDVTILKLDRAGRNWVPLTPEQALTSTRGKYLAQVRHRYFHKSEDIADWEDWSDVKWNKIDEYLHTNFGGAGTLTSHLLDAASMLNAKVFAGASVSVDTAARIIKEFGEATKDLVKGMLSLPKHRRAFLENVWEKANINSTKIDRHNFAAHGISAGTELEMHMKFRQINDALYHLENAGYRNLLRSKGYSVFQDTSGSTIFAKDAGDFKPKKLTNVLDLSDGTVKVVKKDEVERLMKAGGRFGRLDKGQYVEPTKMATHVMTLNDTNSWARSVNRADQPLRYNEGYYQIHYRDPIFIEEFRVTGEGAKEPYVIGTARNTAEAERIMETLRGSGNGDFEWVHRLDKKNDSMSNEDMWSAAVQQGRTASRVRGQTLNTGNTAVFGEPRLISPSESIARNIHDISQRTSMGDWLSSTKARMMANFKNKNVLPKQGKKEVWPQKFEDIKGTSAEAGDLRTMWEYVHRMESSWINHADDITKSAMYHLSKPFAGRNNRVAQMAEEFFLNRYRGTGVTSYAKKKVFQAYLALNPIRQAVVQSHQLVQLTGLEHRYVISGKLHKELAILNMASISTQGFLRSKISKHALKWNNMSRSELINLMDDWKRSGMADAVDQNNLVRSDWEHALTGGPLSTTGKLFDKKVVAPIQKIGFDAGERVNVQAAWLAFRNRAKKAGKDLNDKAVMDQVTADARNFTLNMNRAGDMPYNNNALGIAFQFLQVPHKATTQVLFNQSLTVGEKMKMFAWNTIMYGLPASYFVEDFFPDFGVDDVDTREFIKRGAETTVLNWLLGAATGEEQNIDFSNLSPWDASSVGDLAEVFWEDGIGQMLYESPAGQLAGKRIPQAFKALAEWTGVGHQWEDPKTFANVAEEFMSIASGPANMSKSLRALYIAEAGEMLNSMGDHTISATTLEKLAKMAGFRTYEEAELVGIAVDLSKNKAEIRESVRDFMKEYTRHLKSRGRPVAGGIDPDEAYREAFRVFNKNPIARAEVSSWISRAMKDPNLGLLQTIFTAYAEKVIDAPEYRAYILNHPTASAEQKEMYLRHIEEGYYSSKEGDK